MVSGVRRLQVNAVCVVVAGVIVGMGTAWLGWLGPSFSRWASSPASTALMLAGGWSLISVGAASLWRGRGRIRGVTLSAAGFAWFVAEWVNPASAPAIVFTLGLLLGSAWPVLLTHGVFDADRPAGSDRARRLILAAAYIVNVGILGVVATIAFDPAAARCSSCPPNLLSIGSDPALAAAANRWGLALEVGWIVAAVASLLWGIARAPVTERQRAAMVRVPVAIGLVAVGLDAAYSIPRGLRSNDTVDMVLGSVAALALMAVAAAEVAGWVRRRQTRQRVARLALELATAPAAGELAPALGRELADPTLEVLYPLDDGQLVDAAGIARVLPADATRSTTQVRRGGAAVAVLVHRAGMADDHERMADAVDAARLALENERLHAQRQARLLELRTSRRQIVSAAEAERRRLERDLHDGSQQRLLAFAIDLALARRQASGGSPGVDDRELVAIESEVRASLEELRELAHGIIPRALADDGLGPALEELAERSVVPIELIALPSERLDRTVEAAAYVIVARLTREPVVRRASIDAGIEDGSLIVDLRLGITGEVTRSTLVDVEDRCGAVDGTMVFRVPPDGQAAHLRLEIPCGS